MQPKHKKLIRTMMEKAKDQTKIPLCDLSLCNMPKRFLPSNPQLTPRRISKRISSMQIKREKEAEESTEGETSEEENITPEEGETSDEEYINPEEGETSDEDYINPEKEKKVKIKKDFEKEKKAKIKEDFEYTEKSDYEKMIDQNRARSLAFLQSLQLDEVKEGFRQAVQDLNPKKKIHRIHRKKRPSSNSPPVRRKSKRLANIDIDLSEEALMERAIKEAEEEVEIPKVLPENLKFEEALQEKELYSNFVQDFSELDYKEPEKSYGVKAHLKNMKLTQSQVAKVVPARITALDIHPVCDKIIITAGNKYGHVGFWSMNSDSEPYVFRPHLEGVTNVKYNPYDSNQIVSSSYDGTLRCGDMEKQVFQEVYNVSDETCCTFFDVVSKTTFIVGHKSGDVAVVDNRSKKSVKKHSCHDYTVKSLCVHPVNKNYFISSGLKGAIKLWDLRKLQQEPVAHVDHHRRSVTSAFFSPVTGHSILSTCMDDSLCIFDSANLSDNISLKKRIEHNNRTGRWLSTFKAIWVPYSDDTFVVGSMLSPRRIEVFRDNGDLILSMVDEDLGSITCLHAFHPTLPVLAGGNSSGKVYVFTHTT